MVRTMVRWSCEACGTNSLEAALKRKPLGLGTLPADAQACSPACRLVLIEDLLREIDRLTDKIIASRACGGC
ncbi:MAG: hypothetical protein A2V77_21870 [Anaeromyxobacter sp. RBG_16_69_14]|nr:MAG: hypothetical protein A2V77_21870 [Anaeromyxobacter sp. RBG_16_69_14]